MQVAQQCDRLVEFMRQLESCLVAYSGGVDSAVVAKAAAIALGPRAVAVTAVSASLATGELAGACELAGVIGIRHEIIRTEELERSGYAANGFDRCYHCKTELYSRLLPLQEQLRFKTLVNGANVDDLSDYRPGLRAAAEYKVVSPLADLGLTKDDVRDLARAWQLPVAEKLASPCLASRIAYGEEVTPDRLRMIDRAEQWLRERGHRDVRVRYHAGDLARIEVPTGQLLKLAGLASDELPDAFQSFGFKYVTLDLQGRRSGSHNIVVPVDALQQSATDAKRREEKF